MGFNKIVLLSHTPRDSIFKVGSYHISKILAYRGYEVLYISSPLSLFHFILFIFKGKWKELIARLKYINVKRDQEGVWNHTPLLLFPFPCSGNVKLNKLFYEKLNINLSRTKSQIKKLNFETPEIVLLDALKLDVLTNLFQTKKFAYRATDIYTAMSGSRGMGEIERSVVKKAAVVIVTSEPLKIFFRDNYGVEANIIINGVDYEHFSQPRSKPDLYKKIQNPICIYVGSFDFRFDFSQLEFFKRRKDISLVLIGPLKNESLIPISRNIHFLGQIDYNEIPGYLQHATIGILPLKMIEANHGRSPMKLYEFAAAGLPIASPKLREIVRRRHKFITLYDLNENNIEEVVLKTILEHQGLRKLASEEARWYSWEVQVDKLIELLH